MPEPDPNPIRAALTQTAREARFLRDLAHDLEALIPALAVGRDGDLVTTERSLFDLLNHPTMLTGYFDGFAARTKARVRLKIKLPPRGTTRSGLGLVQLTHTAASLVLEELEALIARDNDGLRFAEQGPTRPGPLRTAEVCRDHLRQLGEHVAIVVDEHAVWDAHRQRHNAS